MIQQFFLKLKSVSMSQNTEIRLESLSHCFFSNYTSCSGPRL